MKESYGLRYLEAVSPTGVRERDTEGRTATRRAWLTMWKKLAGPMSPVWMKGRSVGERSFVGAACLSGSEARLWARGRVGEDKDHQRTVTTPTVWRATCFPRGSPAGSVPDTDVIYSAITAPGVETHRKVCYRFTSTTSTCSSVKSAFQELQLCTYTSSNTASWQISSIHQERLQRCLVLAELKARRACLTQRDFDVTFDRVHAWFDTEALRVKTCI
jgi:hypothetical protein